MEKRTERVSAALEGHLKRCEAMLAGCDERIAASGRWGEWDLRNILGLSKLAVQIGTAIGRLEPRDPSRKACAVEEPAHDPASVNGNGHAHQPNGNGHGISESSGSIPQ